MKDGFIGKKKQIQAGHSKRTLLSDATAFLKHPVFRDPNFLAMRHEYENMASGANEAESGYYFLGGTICVEIKSDKKSFLCTSFFLEETSGLVTIVAVGPPRDFV